MKKVLGLDLGVSSIGWALVNEAENEQEISSIIKLGVRVNPLTVDESSNFEKGKSITTNADRTLKRSMRRNLQRYKLRRENLIEILKTHSFISDESILSEHGNHTTFETYRLRARAVTEKVSLQELARILLMINKKRGYKSSRKAKSQDEGQLIDGMEIAKRLYDDGLTPGQLSYMLLLEGKKATPTFYRSDLEAEFDKVWSFQKQFYPEILTDELRENLQNKNDKQTWAICEKPFNIVGIKRVGKRDELKKEEFKWRSNGLSQKLDLEQLAIVLQKINGLVNSSSSYLANISDRSKELYFNRQTVGQYLMAQLDKNPHTRLKNQVFYRQDYLDEFNTIWETQAKYHSILTPELKSEIRDVVIFYQRRLKSQKGLISFCEFESKKAEVEVDGKLKIRTIGQRVIPRSSPLFQEFKVWQTLNNIEVFGKEQKRRKKKKDSTSDVTAEAGDSCRPRLYQEEKELLAAELAIKGKLTKDQALKLLFENYKELDLNYEKIEGNQTQASLFEAYKKIIEESGHEVDFDKKTAIEAVALVKEIFSGLGINTDILHFDSAKPLDQQPMYKLWHLLYSFEGEDAKLIEKLGQLYGFEKEHAAILAGVTFKDDYGSLSARAIHKILPHLKDGNTYDVACLYAGYRHSKNSLTKEEKESKVLKDRLEILPKNTLRNPVVEKILNQMINVINTLVDTYDKPDEIRIELARELKKNADQREKLTKAINTAAGRHEEIRKILQNEFGISSPSRNDIIRYKLYNELKSNGYKTLYSNAYIPRENLYSKEFDVEHIIPQARLFDDSFSNKTLELSNINKEKGDDTAHDYLQKKWGEDGLSEYLQRLEALYKEGVISKTKYTKLKMKGSEIPEDFINRDLNDTQYIAKKAKEMLEELVKDVVPTTGSVTDRLREDWQLIDVMQELNWDKYDALGLTEIIENRDGHKIRRIKDWTKRNDHRHHAMDALTVAFTRRAYIQYLNTLNAKNDKSSEAYAIQQKNLYRDSKGKLRFNPPIPLDDFRTEAKQHLENVLISIKAKNKVTTININKSKNRNGIIKKQQLTPRGQLHNETIYGSIKRYSAKEEKVNASFDENKIERTTSKRYRDALLARLKAFDNDPKKAFTGKNSLSKNPIYLDSLQAEVIPEKVKVITEETIYTIRKDVSPDLKLDKVIDAGIKSILQKRLDEYGGDSKKAFSNLDEKPIWLNEEKGISIKRVTITGISNAQALHDKKDKDGKPILDKDGNKVPVDFVSTSNNHHVAIYRDEKGELQDNVVSFYEATMRANLALPIVDKDYNKNEGWQFLFSMKQNEHFVFPNEKTGFNPKEIDLLNPNNYATISPNLFRVQKFSKLVYGNSAVREYVFRHHLETAVKDSKELKDIAYKNIKSLPIFSDIVKVRTNHIGMIVEVGEY